MALPLLLRGFIGLGAVYTVMSLVFWWSRPPRGLALAFGTDPRLLYHTRLLRRTDLTGVVGVCMAMGDVQPYQRAARPFKPYKPLKRPFNLFAWVASCGSMQSCDRLSI